MVEIQLQSLHQTSKPQHLGPHYNNNRGAQRRKINKDPLLPIVALTKPQARIITPQQVWSREARFSRKIRVDARLANLSTRKLKRRHLLLASCSSRNLASLRRIRQQSSKINGFSQSPISGPWPHQKKSSKSFKLRLPPTSNLSCKLHRISIQARKLIRMRGASLNLQAATTPAVLRLRLHLTIRGKEATRNNYRM